MTSTGRALVARAREVVVAYDGILPSVLGESGLQGVLALGAVSTTLTGLVPMAISKLKIDYPRLNVSVVPGLTTTLVQQVERGALDLAIVSKPPFIPQKLNWLDVAEEPMEVLASIQADSDDPIHLLRTRPFIRFSRSAVVGAMIEQWLQDHNISVRESMELENLETISSMVLFNLGVSIAPKPSVSIMPPPLKHLPLPGPAPIKRLLGVVHRSDTVKSRAINEVYEKIVEAVRQPDPVLPWLQQIAADTQTQQS
nr:LysR substrate-binding domain-containing protein [Aurantimonas sp. VKM B-3413]